MAKIYIKLEDAPGGVTIEAEIDKDVNLEGEGNTEAEELAISIMEHLAESADEVYQEGQLIKTMGNGGIDGKH